MRPDLLDLRDRCIADKKVNCGNDFTVAERAEAVGDEDVRSLKIFSLKPGMAR
jgi:hypothetical protein